MVHNLQSLVEIIAYNSIAALEFSDPEAAKETLVALKAKQPIVSACIYQADGEVFARYHRNGVDFSPPAPESDLHRFEDDHLVLFQQVVFSEEMLGTVYLQADLQELYDRQQQYIRIVILFTLGSTLLAVLLALVLQRPISGPIEVLMSCTAASTFSETFLIWSSPTSSVA